MKNMFDAILQMEGSLVGLIGFGIVVVGAAALMLWWTFTSPPPPADDE